MACDLERTNLVDVVADGEFLPFDGSVFDVVICTQVFEYFPHPIRAAQEIHRVLKPGGRLLMSVVSCAPRFVEEERWRYTPLGIRTVLSSFSQLSIVPETSSFGGLMRFLSLAAHSLSHFQLARKCVEFLLCPCLNLLGLAGEKLRISRNDEFTPNYSVLAIK